MASPTIIKNVTLWKLIIKVELIHWKRVTIRNKGVRLS
jgi:hypothetical protein